jgi:hypothetical protein
MKLRHAAALALVGWYLMVPPGTSKDAPDQPLTFDGSAPLSKWKIVGSYDSASGCDDGKKEVPNDLLQAADRESDEGKKKEFLQWMASLMEAQKCISTDDPRLK